MSSNNPMSIGLGIGRVIQVIVPNVPSNRNDDYYIRVEILNTVTVQILCIGTDRSQQTVQTKIRLLLKKQSDQGLRCLPFHQHLLDA